MKKQLITFGFALGLGCNMFGQQDQHFSMFTESPVYLNPATAGFIPGDMQLFTNYRLQWSTATDNPYRTISASTDWKMLDYGGGRMGAGLNFYNDAAGITKYQTNVISIPVNYAFRINRDNQIAIGLQPAFYQRTIKNTDITWQNQWNGVEFDKTINNDELLLSQNFTVSRFDISAGAYWEGYFTKNAKLKIGVSGQHLTKQRVNFANEDERLYRKLNIHGQAEFKNDLTGVTIMPAFVAFLQGPNKEIVVGSNFRFLLKGASLATNYFDEVTLSVGSYFRVGDALILNTIFNVAGFSFGASYDLNISKLNIATRGVGAMEFFIKYNIEFGMRNLRNNRVH